MTDLPDTETSTVGRNAEFNEVVKCVIIVIKIKFMRCRVTERWVGCRVTERWVGCRVTERCVGCRVTERCVGCLHCAVIGISISI